MVPFLVWSVAVLGLAIVPFLPFAIAVALHLPVMLLLASALPLMLGCIVLAALFFASLYTSYLDVFANVRSQHG
jgi:hypothetical protein